MRLLASRKPFFCGSPCTLSSWKRSHSSHADNGKVGWEGALFSSYDPSEIALGSLEATATLKCADKTERGAPKPPFYIGLRKRICLKEAIANYNAIQLKWVLNFEHQPDRIINHHLQNRN